MLNFQHLMLHPGTDVLLFQHYESYHIAQDFTLSAFNRYFEPTQ